MTREQSKAVGERFKFSRCQVLRFHLTRTCFLSFDDNCSCRCAASTGFLVTLTDIGHSGANTVKISGYWGVDIFYLLLALWIYSAGCCIPPTAVFYTHCCTVSCSVWHPIVWHRPQNLDNLVLGMRGREREAPWSEWVVIICLSCGYIVWVSEPVVQLRTVSTHHSLNY